MRPPDIDWLVELKARAMRPDLERLARWDPARSRHRLLDELVLEATRVVEIAGDPLASIALVPKRQTAWLQHFYVDPTVQERGDAGCGSRAVSTRRCEWPQNPRGATASARGRLARGAASRAGPERDGCAGHHSERRGHKDRQRPHIHGGSWRPVS